MEELEQKLDTEVVKLEDLEFEYNLAKNYAWNEEIVENTKKKYEEQIKNVEKIKEEIKKKKSEGK